VSDGTKGQLSRLFSLQLVSRRLACAAVSNDFVRNLLAFIEARKTSAFNRADVDENVRSTGGWLDESKTLLRVEPFNCT
jgi:hypothetical protein